MVGAEQFDFVAFGASLRGLSRPEQRARVQQELGRIRQIVVREPSWKFKQQVYVKRVERLGRHLAGEEVSLELTPTEIEAYALLATPAEPETRAAAVTVVSLAPGPVLKPAAPASAAATVPPAPAPAAPAAAPAPAEEALGGAERRRSRRIQMRTRVRIRRASDNTVEVLEPLNVSRGGIGFNSSRLYALHERVAVNMHYQPNQPETAGIESVGIIVRAVALGAYSYSYGVKFLD